MSGFTTTPNYALIKPTPGLDNDAWGDHLNSNTDTLDALIPTFLPLSGGTVSGNLTVAGTFNLGAGGAGNAAIVQSGTGNFTVTLGGTASILNIRNSASVSMLQIGGPNNRLNLPNLPTDPTGLATGDIYSNGGVLMVKGP